MAGAPHHFGCRGFGAKGRGSLQPLQLTVPIEVREGLNNVCRLAVERQGRRVAWTFLASANISASTADVTE